MIRQAGLLCVLAAPALAAASDVDHWYVTPKIGGVSVDNDRALEDKDWLYGLAVGKHINEGLSMELNLDGAYVGGGPAAGDLSLYGGSIDLLAVINRAGAFAPYLSLGLGMLQTEPSPGTNATDFMAQAGLGAMLKLAESADGSRSLALRPEVKARWSEAGASGTLVDYIGTLGLQFSFGPARPQPAPAPAPSPPPAEPAPVPQPRDTDQDGVIDDLDKCPDTARGVAIDAYGCPRKGSITLEGVTFELNSARLTAESRTILEGLAADLQKYPRLRIELQGHTDSTGSDQYNLMLSQQRADAVRAYVVAEGVAAAQLIARGYGEGQPTDDNTTEQGRARNRRVVMFVVDNPGDVTVKGEGAVEE